MLMVKVGVIGLGSISDFHLKSYHDDGRAEIVALADMNEQRLKEKGAQYNVSALYTEIDGLLSDTNVEAVSICTWNNTHADLAVKALHAGKHVLVEKPLSITTEEALGVQKAQRQTGKIVQVGFVRRHANNAKWLKDFIETDGLGEIYYAKASCLRRLGNPGGWFSDKTRSGGGPLIDLGVHMIDICWYLMGRPKPVSVSGNAYYKLGNRSNIKHLDFYKAADYDPTVNSVEDLTNAMIRFENGASLLVDVSFTLHAKKDELSCQLYGDKGGAELEPALKVMTEVNDMIFNMDPQIDHPGLDMFEAFQSEISHFVDVIENGAEQIAPVEDGVEVMKMLNAIYQSAKEGREVLL
ncbi:Gfo/Idh/MocA family protein [Jeotgalibacillus malaysiensis]|uniref:Gfo/Idh/MocA family protein n=1 Tax=Jeotgalibacillus malaysiensis TaxID=1508404 RepID=UPI0038511958